MQEHDSVTPPEVAGPEHTGTDAEQGADLEYDLAHEAAPAAPEARPGQEQPPQVYVPTETRDYDGDYGYDMAHDVPGR